MRRASHDLANPFNAISMNVEFAKLLLERGKRAKSIEMLDQALADCARCRELIQAMQEFSAAVNMHGRETLSVRQLAENAVAAAMKKHSDGLIVRYSGDGDARVDVATPAFTRMIGGLLTNAIEAGSTAMEISFAREAPWIVVELSDNGHGMDACQRELATQGFYTTRRGEGHAGLGLTLANALVGMHAGRLALAANTNGGTAVTIYLPAT
ncbi:MAG TPA: HAMP domain-containing sensor histidine kinase [Rudaea sp.]|nr:HAMP domain-containing sensor histidine kinase [Rudaea sp.]